MSDDSAGTAWADKVIGEKLAGARLPNLGGGYSDRHRAAYAVKAIADRKIQQGPSGRLNRRERGQRAFWRQVQMRAAEVMAAENGGATEQHTQGGTDE